MSKVSIIVDGNTFSVNSGDSLLRACLSAGLNVPYFCWHPALESVGACRQCAVKIFKDEKDTRGKIVMSCMTPVSDGMRLSIEDADVATFRARNIEWLMLNHPHDCPVCDEGGECHLQDMTVMTGHSVRRTRFRKRTYQNQDLGPFVNHEMNRCIQCYRCVRFYRDYASGRDFDVFASHDWVYFGRHEDGKLQNHFSGNLVEICPTGVFTDKTEKKYFTRKWDLQTAPSVCVHCSLGCNTIPGERYGQLRRIRNRFNGSVNGYFLCDRGRYGYEFVNSPDRILRPAYRENRRDACLPLTTEAAIEYFGTMLTGGKRIVGIGSPRASVESNFALRKLVGSERFFAGVQRREHALISQIIEIMRNGPVPAASLAETGSSDAVLILGEDISNTAPVLALTVLQACRNQPMKAADTLRIPRWEDRAVREAIQHRTAPFFVAASGETWLDDKAKSVFRAAPWDLSRFGFAVAHELCNTCPDVGGLDSRTADLARSVAATLKSADRPLIISGTGLGDQNLIEAAANVAWSLMAHSKNTRLCFVPPECNSIGLGLMNAQPLEDALRLVDEEGADTIIILENDLFRRGERDRITACLNKCKHVIVLDHLPHGTTSLADLVLPAATFAESSGTLVSNEGRGQRYFQVFVPEGEMRASWHWLGDCMAATGAPDRRPWLKLDDLIGEIDSELPVFRGICDIAPSADFRTVGLKVPRKTRRESGRASMYADKTMHEPPPPYDPDSPLAFSVEGYHGQPPAALIPRYRAPGWNSVQALNKFQMEVGGSLRGGDPGRRFVEPRKGNLPDYFPSTPDAFSPAGSFRVVPLYHIFGSDELSMYSPSIHGLAPHIYVLLNPDDAAHLDVREGETVRIIPGDPGSEAAVPVVLNPAFPKGAAGLPSGVSPLWPIAEKHIEIKKANQ